MFIIDTQQPRERRTPSTIMRLDHRHHRLPECHNNYNHISNIHGTTPQKRRRQQYEHITTRKREDLPRIERKYRTIFITTNNGPRPHLLYNVAGHRKKHQKPPHEQRNIRHQNEDNRTTYLWVFQPPHFSPSGLFPTTNPPMSNPGKSSCSQSLILVSHRGGSRLGYSTSLIGKNKWVRPTTVSKPNTESIIRRCNGRLWRIE